MSSERALQERIIKLLRRAGAHVHKHRDAAAGVPDLSYALEGRQGWLELKYQPGWPARKDTPVGIGLRPEQVLWIEAREKACNGSCSVLVQIDRELLLFGGSQVSWLMQGQNTKTLRHEAICWQADVRRPLDKLFVEYL